MSKLPLSEQRKVDKARKLKKKERRMEKKVTPNDVERALNDRMIAGGVEGMTQTARSWLGTDNETTEKAIGLMDLTVMHFGNEGFLHYLDSSPMVDIPHAVELAVASNDLQMMLVVSMFYPEHTTDIAIDVLNAIDEAKEPIIFTYDGNPVGALTIAQFLENHLRTTGHVDIEIITNWVLNSADVENDEVATIAKTLLLTPNINIDYAGARGRLVSAVENYGTWTERATLCLNIPGLVSDEGKTSVAMHKPEEEAEIVDFAHALIKESNGDHQNILMFMSRLQNQLFADTTSNIAKEIVEDMMASQKAEARLVIPAAAPEPVTPLEPEAE